MYASLSVSVTGGDGLNTLAIPQPYPWKEKKTKIILTFVVATFTATKYQPLKDGKARFLLSLVPKMELRRNHSAFPFDFLFAVCPKHLPSPLLEYFV